VEKKERGRRPCPSSSSRLFSRRRIVEEGNKRKKKNHAFGKNGSKEKRGFGLAVDRERSFGKKEKKNPSVPQ